MDAEAVAKEVEARLQAGDRDVLALSHWAFAWPRTAAAVSVIGLGAACAAGYGILAGWWRGEVPFFGGAAAFALGVIALFIATLRARALFDRRDRIVLHRVGSGPIGSWQVLSLDGVVAVHHGLREVATANKQPVHRCSVNLVAPDREFYLAHYPSAEAAARVARTVAEFLSLPCEEA